MKKTALLIIDVQKDYFPGGRSELYHAVEAENAVLSLIEDCRKSDMPIIYMQHIQPEGSSFLAEGTPGIEIEDRIRPEEGDIVIVKHHPNSFLETPLDDVLKENSVEKLIVCGMMTHMCVDTTVRRAYDLGYEVDLAASACATKDLYYRGERIVASQVQDSFLAAIDGTFATVI